jgi:hypothetical protein
MLGLLAVTVAVPTATELLGLNQLGFTVQGRYLLPTMVGVFMLAAHALAERLLDGRRVASLIRLVAVVSVPIQLVFLDLTMVKWQVGYTYPVQYPAAIPVNPFHEVQWHPPIGSATAIATGVAGAVTLLVFAWAATARQRSSPTDSMEDADTFTAVPVPATVR